MVQDIDNGKDLKAYVSSFASKVTPRHIDARYEPHAVCCHLRDCKIVCAYTIPPAVTSTAVIPTTAHSIFS